MSFRRIVTASVLAATMSAVGLAGPASATDGITENAAGIYDVDIRWGPKTWVAVPCEDNADQCLHITSFSPQDATFKHPQWTANAYWLVGSWTIQGIDTPNAIQCKEDGSKHNAAMTYSWNAATNEGYVSFFNPGICDGKAKTTSAPINLTKIGPPPASNDATAR